MTAVPNPLYSVAPNQCVIFSMAPIHFKFKYHSLCMCKRTHIQNPVQFELSFQIVPWPPLWAMTPRLGTTHCSLGDRSIKQSSMKLLNPLSTKWFIIIITTRRAPSLSGGAKTFQVRTKFGFVSLARLNFFPEPRK